MNLKNIEVFAFIRCNAGLTENNKNISCVFISDSIGKELEEAGIPNPYTAQGEGQPFGYTGYRYDTVSGTYFAQAREYQPGTGRFCAQDVIAGNGAAPETLNRYGYCLGNLMKWIDKNGEEPEDYEYIYYVNNPGAAGGFGHTAFLLVKKNGMAEYYSYSTVQGKYVGKIFDSKTDNTEYEGRLYTNVEDDVQQDISINDFIEYGYVDEHWYFNGNWAGRGEGEFSDKFTRGIIIPISDEQGEKIHDAAQELLYNPGVYNLWSIPNQEYLLATMAANYYEYETIRIGEDEKCINDK